MPTMQCQAGPYVVSKSFTKGEELVIRYHEEQEWKNTFISKKKRMEEHRDEMKFSILEPNKT